MYNQRERRCSVGSCDGRGGMSGGDFGYDAVVVSCDGLWRGGHLLCQEVSSYGVVQVDNIDV